MDNEKLIKKTKYKKIFCSVFSLILLLGFGIISFIPISKNNVNAVVVHQTEFIQKNQYCISTNNNISFYNIYNNDSDYLLIVVPTSSLYICFKNSSDLINGDNQVYLGYVDSDFNSVMLPLSMTYNSQRIRFYTDVSINILGYMFNSNNNQMTYRPFTIYDFEINIPRQYQAQSKLEFLISSANFTRFQYYSYVDDESINSIKLRSRTIYSAYNNFGRTNIDTSFDLFTMYFTLDDVSLINNVSTGVVHGTTIKTDRSNYITEKIEYVNPTDDLFGTITNGVSIFMGIEIFPNFPIGNLLLIILGVTFFAFLLHLIVK